MRDETVRYVLNHKYTVASFYIFLFDGVMPLLFKHHLVTNYRRRVSTVVEHSSANPKVPSLISGPVSYRGHG